MVPKEGEKEDEGLKHKLNKLIKGKGIDNANISSLLEQVLLNPTKGTEHKIVEQMNTIQNIISEKRNIVNDTRFEF